MAFRLAYLVICALSFIPQLQAEEEPITVRLASENQLMPLYLSALSSPSSDFETGYLRQLDAILQFDLNYNGMTYTVGHSADRDAIATGSFDTLGNPTAWRSLGVFYVIKVQIDNKRLAARVLAVNNDAVKSIEGIQLSGDLAKDRRQVHLLADKIHKVLFGTEGVATTRILYTVKNNEKKPTQWVSEVWEADWDGGVPRQITKNGEYCVTPVYVPAKAGFAPGSFLYVSYKGGQSKIYVSSLKTGQGQRVSPLRGNQLMPSINRQRDNLAFISDYTGNPDLFLLPFSPETGANGKPQQIYATHQATQGSPTFDPEGKRVAFVSNKDGSPRIYVMDIPAPGASIKDIQARLLTKRNRESSAPSWSPDGKKIAYCSMSSGVRQIWIYDFDKKEERQLTQGPGNKENPTWAPNSLHLMFNSTGNDGSELYLVNLNQPAAYRLPLGNGDKRFPNWEPR